MTENPKKDKPPKKLTEKFQQFGKTEVLPEELKKEVFGTLDTLNLFADIADLFTAKFTMTELEAFGISTELEASISEVKHINKLEKPSNIFPKKKD